MPSKGATRAQRRTHLLVVSLALTCFMVAKAIGAKHNLRTALIAVFLSLAIFFAFNEGLQLQLPSGLDTVDSILNPVDENAPVEEIVDENGVVVEEDGGW